MKNSRIINALEFISDEKIAAADEKPSKITLLPVFISAAAAAAVIAGAFIIGNIIPTGNIPVNTANETVAEAATEETFAETNAETSPANTTTTHSLAGYVTTVPEMEQSGGTSVLPAYTTTAENTTTLPIITSETTISTTLTEAAAETENTTTLPIITAETTASTTPTEAAAEGTTSTVTDSDDHPAGGSPGFFDCIIKLDGKYRRLHVLTEWDYIVEEENGSFCSLLKNASDAADPYDGLFNERNFRGYTNKTASSIQSPDSPDTLDMLENELDTDFFCKGRVYCDGKEAMVLVKYSDNGGGGNFYYDVVERYERHKAEPEIYEYEGSYDPETFDYDKLWIAYYVFYDLESRWYDYDELRFQ